MLEIRESSLRLEWIPTILAKAFINDVMEEYYVQSTNDLAPIDKILDESGAWIIDALSWKESNGLTTQTYWREMDDKPHYSAAIYNEAVSHAYKDVYKDLKIIMDYYNLSHRGSQLDYDRDKLRHYCKEVW